MSMNDSPLQEISLLIQDAQRILVVSHIRPDGDAVGSLLGLGLAFEEAGKQVQMVLADGVPKVYRFLDGHERVVKMPDGSFDLVCTLDTSDMGRAGNALDDYDRIDVNIDHHVTNINYAKHNLIDPYAVSTTEMLAEIIPTLLIPISTEIASALLTGLVTDSLGFRTPNTTPKSLRTAAGLIECGADLHEIYKRTMVNKSYAATQLWGFGLGQLDRRGGLVWASLTMQDRKTIGYQGRDDADLINVLSSIEDADIALIFNELPNGHIKVSWRSVPEYDVSQIALSFGGGGHPTAPAKTQCNL